MLRDSVPFAEVWEKVKGTSRGARAVTSVANFFERRLGAAFVYDAARMGYEPELADLYLRARTLAQKGVISEWGRFARLPDEPQVAHWYALYGSGLMAAGSTVDDDRLALTIALSEAQERHVWYNYTDFFVAPRRASVARLSGVAHILAPERFAGWSAAQRAAHPRLSLSAQSEFTWTRGYSWVRRASVWVPAQVVSGQAFAGEPLIRSQITTGLATHPSRLAALLSGALEVIERDAYSITWLNQLTPPQLDLARLAERRPSLARLLAQCERYRFAVHALRLVTDAPAYAVCAVLEDQSGVPPRFGFGLKAHRDPAFAAERAILEALRGRGGMARKSDSWERKPTSEITQYERIKYWAQTDAPTERLEFLIRGPVQPFTEEWEGESDQAYFDRLVGWCAAQGYEFASVSLARSRGNVLGFPMECVVIPELQPLHYLEKLPSIAGRRLSEVPQKLGYTPREPYLADPHPFA